MKLLKTALAFALLLPLAAQADWHQFHGPDGNGHSLEKGLMRSWPRSGPKALWTQKIGVGFGGAAIRDGEVVILDRRDDASDVLRVFALSSGTQLWERSFAAPGRLSYNGSRSVPTIGPERIYACGPFGQVYCVDRKRKELIWQRSFLKDFDSSIPGFGFSQSPLLAGNTIILAPQSPKFGLVGLDAATGKLLWKAAGVSGGGHSTPRLISLHGQQQVVFISRSEISSVDPSSGKRLWTFTGFRNKNPIPFPTVIGKDRLFITAGYRAGSVMIRINKTAAAGFSTEQLFRIDRKGSQIHPAFLMGKHLYANFNENANLRRSPEGLVCIDPESGKLLWRTQADPHIERGPLLAVDGLLLSLGGQDGVLRLIEPRPEGYKELAHFRAFEGLRRRNNNIWAPMAFSNGCLLIRNQNSLRCFQLKRGAPTKGKAGPAKPAKQGKAEPAKPAKKVKAEPAKPAKKGKTEPAKPAKKGKKFF